MRTSKGLIQTEHFKAVVGTEIFEIVIVGQKRVQFDTASKS